MLVRNLASRSHLLPLGMHLVSVPKHRLCQSRWSINSILMHTYDEYRPILCGFAIITLIPGPDKRAEREYYFSLVHSFYNAKKWKSGKDLTFFPSERIKSSLLSCIDSSYLLAHTT